MDDKYFTDEEIDLINIGLACLIKDYSKEEKMFCVNNTEIKNKLVKLQDKVFKLNN